MNRRLFALAMGSLLVWASTGCAPVTPQEESGIHVDLQRMGREDYIQYCASCHGADGRGRGPVAPALKVAPADLTGIAARRGGAFPRTEIAYVIDGRFELSVHGTRDMPIWGRKFREGLPQNETGEALVRGRIAGLVEYLMSIQEP
ncbi:MAG: 3-methyladenine DNA glycosylase [Deltaproteobacteria bacterium]|jgi:mono/diheme cytochrome c family protein|nr:3-methyladenine DNA glycosylase [Deltaproteobacteria bacterium]